MGKQGFLSRTDEKKMSEAIVTGATGFIGLALCRELLQNGYQVNAVIRPDSYKKDKLFQLQEEFRASEGVLQILETELAGLSDLSGRFGVRADYFFHLAWNGSSGAAREDFDIQQSNLSYTGAALRAAKDCGCKRFIGAGSQAEYGVVNGTAREEETVPRPFMMYGAAKLAACRMGELLARQLEIGFVWPRIYSVYGVGENPGTLLSYVLESLLTEKEPELSPCENMWNFLYITDCARALRFLAEEEFTGICHVASKDTRPLKEFVTEARDVVSPGSPLGFGRKPSDPARTFWLEPDVSRLESVGFVPEVSFAEGIQKKMEETKKRDGQQKET